MARDDIFNALTGMIALAHTTNAAITDLTANGAIIDLQGETGGVFLVNIAAITAGSISLGIDHGDTPTLTDADAVTDPLLIQKTAQNIAVPGMHKVAYMGIKRYIRLTVTGAATTGAVASAIYASAKQDQGAMA